MTAHDPLWSEFAPIWVRIGAIEPRILVLGGYGLFLKQLWIAETLSAPSQPIAIPLGNWRDAAPRATNDIDLGLCSDVMADAAHHATILSAITEQGFSELTPRWQYTKQIDTGQQVKVELHAPDPSGHAKVRRTDSFRVKLMGNSSQNLLHGRANAEAIALDQAPCPISVQSTDIHVPNVITWCTMKMTAAADQWNRSEDQAREAARRGWSLAQAEKHAADVGRIIALMQPSERAAIPTILAGIVMTSAYGSACAHRQRNFQVGGRAQIVLERQWRPEDVQLQLELLASWFP